MTVMLTAAFPLSVQGLSSDELALVSKLVGKLEAKKPYNDLREKYFDGQDRVRQLGIAVPPQLRDLLAIVGWPGMAVSVLEERLDWQGVARFVVAAFRADVARAGAAAKAEALVEELCRSSPEFAAMWRDNDVRRYGEGLKQLHHPAAGPIAFEYSAFSVDGRPDLGMVVYNPATAEDAERVRALIDGSRIAPRAER